MTGGEGNEMKSMFSKYVERCKAALSQKYMTVWTKNRCLDEGGLRGRITNLEAAKNAGLIAIRT